MHFVVVCAQSTHIVTEVDLYAAYRRQTYRSWSRSLTLESRSLRNSIMFSLRKAICLCSFVSSCLAIFNNCSWLACARTRTWWGHVWEQSPTACICNSLMRSSSRQQLFSSLFLFVFFSNYYFSTHFWVIRGFKTVINMTRLSDLSRKQVGGRLNESTTNRGYKRRGSLIR